MIDQGNNAEVVERMKGAMASAEALSIAFYTGNGYIPMNRVLRGDVAKLPLLENIIYSAASGLNKLDKFEGTVYRTENLNVSMLKAIRETLKVGNIVLEEVFLSTTRLANLGFAKPSSGVNISYAIQSKTGRSVVSLSAFQSEDEVLFAPGTAFRVLSYSEEVTQKPNSFLGIPLSSVPVSIRLKVELEEVDPV